MAHALPEGTLTVLFTDVEGSTPLGALHGDRPAHEILRRQRDLVRRQIEQHQGTEIKTMGDGFMVAFSSARRAVACAAEIQRDMATENRAHPGLQVLLRIGINTGEVIQEEGDLFGLAVTAAERISAKAKGGEILVSDAVRSVIGRSGELPLLDRGRFRLKGFPERWRLHAVLWEPEPLPTPVTLLAERTPFVARDAECARLNAMLDRAVGGEGALALIGGEPGVGKTRLARELAVEARKRGVLAFSGGAYEQAGTPPYTPFIEILESAARIIPRPALRTALGDALPDVAHLMPGLRRIVPDAPPELPPEAAPERHEVFTGVTEFLARASRPRPLLLVLDDLHWADEATLGLLQHIARSLADMPVLILGTFRVTDAGDTPHFARALEELHRQRLAQRLDLRPFALAGVEAMLSALSGKDPPAAVTDAILAATEGNAFFVEELSRHLAEEGRLFDSSGAWRDDLRLADLPLPAGVRPIIDGRLNRLPAPSRPILSTAALTGREFTVDVLERACDAKEDTLFDAIDEAERAGIIEPRSAAPDTPFRFTQELIRQALIGDLTTTRRQRLHLRIAQALDALPAQREQRVGDLAYHYRMAGRLAPPMAVIAACRAAGDAALQVQALVEAGDHYQAALQLVESLPGGAPRQRAYLLHHLAQAYYRLGQWTESGWALDEAAALYRGLGLPGEAAEVAFSRAVLATFQADASEALVQLAAARAGIADDRLRGLALQLEAQNLVQLRRYDDAARVISEAADVAERVGESYLTVRTHIASGYLALSTLDMPRAADDFARALEVGGIGEHERTGSTSRRAVALACVGRLDEAAAAADSACAVFRRVRDPYELGLACATAAMIAIARGRFAEARTLVDEALAPGPAPPNAWVLMSLLPVTLQVHYYRGQLSEGVEQAKRRFQPHLLQPRLPMLELFEALAAAADGARAESIEARIAMPVTRRTPDRQTVPLHVIAAEVALMSRSRPLAETQFETLFRLHGRGLTFAPDWFALLPRLLGGLCVVLERWDDAARLLGEALAAAERSGAAPEQALVHLELAALHAARGDASPGDALAQLDEARRRLAGLEMRAWSRRLANVELALDS